MSGLQGYVGRTGRISSSGGQPVRDDRVAALNLKISSRDASKRSSAASKKPTNTFPEAQFLSQSYGTAAPPHINLMRAPLSRGGLDDSSVEDNFDHTRSEAHFSQRLDEVESVHGDQELNSDGDASAEEDLDLVGQQEDLRGGYDGADGRDDDQEEYKSEPIQENPPRSLRRSSGSPIAQRQQQAPRQSAHSSGISGRFSKSLSFPIRPAQQEHAQNMQMQQKKRPHTPELPPNSRHYEQDHQSQQPDAALPISSDGAGHEGEAEDNSKNISPDRTPRRPQQQPRNSQHMPSEPDIPEGAQSKKQRIIPDHTIEELKGMTYSQLDAEPWDIGNGQGHNNRPLQERLQEIISQTGTDGPNLPTVEFFSKMSTAEWEESGEWFVDRFSEIMQDMREKRKQRRVLMAKYENELKEREKAVRGKSEALDKKFRDMRASGEDMLRGKF